MWIFISLLKPQNSLLALEKHIQCLVKTDWCYSQKVVLAFSLISSVVLSRNEMWSVFSFYQSNSEKDQITEMFLISYDEALLKKIPSVERGGQSLLAFQIRCKLYQQLVNLH